MTLGEGVLLGIENPLLDLSNTVDAQFLKKYNLKENDAILADKDHFPIYKELAQLSSTVYVPGGAAQNSMRGAQRLLPKGSTTYIGCIGKDEFGEKLTKVANDDGVQTAYMVHPTVSTGTCAVLINGKNRSLVAYLGAANEYKPEHLDETHIQELLQKARIFYIGGFFLTVSPPSIMKICVHAAMHNKLLTMNLSAPFISEFFKQPLSDLLEYADYVFGNETEARALAKSFGFVEDNDVPQIAKLIQKLPKKTNRYRTVVITQGSDDVVVVDVHGIKTFKVEPINANLIVDTNGAGDAFVGGFLSQLVLDRNTEKCVQAGNYLAKEVIQQSGCIYPMNLKFE
eukprot:NODE_5_length_49639_cov_0.484336.p12 type:complete len:342 gc:universal NODE_5_length_49639_cov_0.484336:34459-33434(-)